MYAELELGVNMSESLIVIRERYLAVRKRMGQKMLKALFLPFGVYYGLKFRKNRKAFQRRIDKHFTDFESPKEYVHFIGLIEKMDEILHPITEIIKNHPKKKVWPYMFSLNELDKMISTLNTYNGWLKKELNVYNKKVNIQEYSGFEFISGDKLWEKRVKVYEYLA